MNAGGGDSLENVSHQLEQEKKELQQLKSRIEKQERTIQVAGSKETSVLKTLRRIEDRLKLKERE
nr:hypothetical protein [Nitrospinaceae bacterium]NIR55791.1 hypothetical protein [Nitrospinaceae bacterium]NIS86243.1 hypothetical protein [Nitrospinaceae bacterium]NIT80912.1 hypothetical protein [Nitrospinaceae bacterium]NIU43210.1 hypothetical protein [Nitrospinaceae bacterium]